MQEVYGMNAQTAKKIIEIVGPLLISLTVTVIDILIENSRKKAV